MLTTNNARSGRPVVAVIGDGTTGFGRNIVRGVMRYVNVERRWLIHQELNTDALESEYWPEFSGAIIAGAPEPLKSAVAAKTRHLVICSGSSDPAEHPVVSLDDYAVGVLAAEHLLTCRLKRFAFYGLSEARTSINRYQGFRNTIERAGNICVESGFGWLRPGATIDLNLFKTIISWLQAVEKPIGIMCIDDSSAQHLATACLEAGISVPDEVAIIGVNNDDLLCDSSWPPISSVDGDYSRAGFAAAHLLDRLMRGETLAASERAIRLAPQRVVLRQSTDMLAVSDPYILDAVRFIREHACDPCTVKDVLRHVPVTRRWLERHFASIVGHGLYDEILRVRIEAAKRLLLQPELGLESVSDRCGFSMIQQFRRAFQRSTGTTPGAFRRARVLGKI